MTNRFYITTPIYYVNDRPHIGHIYTTLLADVIARFHRRAGEDVFFLTGTDEHAPKVVESAAAHGVTPLAWANQNAARFQETFATYGISNDDFIRTSQARHVERVQTYLAALLESGDVYPGHYEGWYDASQEEYVPDARAAAFEYTSPVTGRPLVRRQEENYFFRLSAFADDLLGLLGETPEILRPDARRNEIVARIRDGLHDIPISRAGVDWGISIPGDERHKVYVWIDALFNYLTVVDTPERRQYWPADLHLIAKDILWFHAVIWPALLLALRRRPGYDWVELPRQVYAHSFWVSGGLKMSKSLGNFVDLERLDRCREMIGLDGLRYFLATQGPLDIADRDYTDERVVEVYNAELANLFGNLVQRATALVTRFAGGIVPEPGPLEPIDEWLRAEAAALPGRVTACVERLSLDQAAQAIMSFGTAANRYAEETAPWQLARAGNIERLATTLYHLVEAARLTAWHLSPFIPESANDAHRRISGQDITSGLGTFGVVLPGAHVTPGAPLFPRVGS
jgi:methionyl-tRNA synthetase